MTAKLKPSRATAVEERNGRNYRAALSAAPYAFSFAVLVLVWFIVANYLFKSALFPSPISVARTGLHMIEDGTLLAAILASMQRIIAGFVVGSLVGVPIGLLVGSFGLARGLIEPWTEFFRFIPATAMITIVVIWFGIGEESKIFLIAYATIFIVILNTAAGVASIAPNKLRAARALGATGRQVFFLVTLPAAVPFILTGMRLAMAQSFSAIIAAELIAAQTGLGVTIWNARMFMLVDQIFVALFTVGVLGFWTDRLFRYGIYRFARRYSPVA